MANPRVSNADRDMMAELRHSDRQVKSGHYIRHGDMKAWLLSWGANHELPLPKCVCGARHDDGPAMPVEIVSSGAWG